MQTFFDIYISYSICFQTDVNLIYYLEYETFIYSTYSYFHELYEF